MNTPLIHWPTALLAAELFELDWLVGARVLGVALWVGLAVLTVTLLILMRTSWGQARPLSKCVALSVFAHVLLMGYAYGTKLIFDPPAAPRRDEVIRLTTVSEHKPDVRRSSDSAAPDSWERFPAAAAPNIERDAPQRLAPELDIARTEARAATGRYPAELPGGDLPTAAVARRAPAAPGVEALQSDSPREAMEIEAPMVRRRAKVEPATPEIASLGRRAAPRTSADRDTLSPPAAGEPDQGGRIQRMDDLASTSDIAAALADQTDDLTRASNRRMAPAEPGGALKADVEPTQDESALAPAATISHGKTPQTGADAPAIDQVLRSLDARRPTRRVGDGAALPRLYQARVGDERIRIGRLFGATVESEEAVEAALAWLAAHQADDGRWDPSQFGAGRETKVLGHDRGGAGAEADTGITGLAALAFLAHGETHLEGKYRRNVQHALQYLLDVQRPDGCLAGDARLYASMYCHGMATLALSEAYALSGDHRLRTAVEAAVEYTVASQSSTSGGWRYQPHDSGDMSQFGWQVMALESAALAGVEIPEQTHEGMRRFLESVSSGEAGGLASYRPTGGPSRTMTAEALVCRVFLGQDRSEALIDEATEFILGELPQDGKANLYYWYYATLALHQVQGEAWNAWNARLQQQLLQRQRTEGPWAGSWDADSVWGSYGGRVYSTAMAALCLEIYNRYLPLYAKGARPARVARQPE